MTIFNVTYDEKNFVLKLSFLFGLSIFGNLVDNMSQPKALIVYAQLALSLYWIYTGIVICVAENTEPKDQ